MKTGYPFILNLSKAEVLKAFQIVYFVISLDHIHDSRPPRFFHARSSFLLFVDAVCFEQCLNVRITSHFWSKLNQNDKFKELWF